MKNCRCLENPSFKYEKAPDGEKGFSFEFKLGWLGPLLLATFLIKILFIKHHFCKRKEEA